MAHLKNCTARVLLDGKTSGTGFVVSPDGVLGSCWHVVEQAFFNHLKIEVEFQTGERVEVGVVNYFLQGGLRQTV